MSYPNDDACHKGWLTSKREQGHSLGSSGEQQSWRLDLAFTTVEEITNRQGGYLRQTMSGQDRISAVNLVGAVLGGMRGIV